MMNLKITSLLICLTVYGNFAFALRHSSSNAQDTQNQTLRQAAEKSGKFIGAAIESTPLQEDPIYAQTIREEFNIFTPENRMKFKYLRPAKDKFDFTEADKLMDFAKSANMKVRGHTLVWFNALPTWLIQEKFSPEELKGILEKHIKTTVGHFQQKYPGSIVAWDVVNEALDDDRRLRSDMLWRKISDNPEEYIRLAFQWAHEAAPNVKLFYNDYGAEEINGKSDAIYNLIQRLKQKGTPIHGIGMQMHMSKNQSVDWESIRKNMKRFAALGLEIHFTEVDYKVENKDLKNPEVLKKQAEAYAQAISLCKREPKCTAFVTWGFTDKYSPIPIQFPGWGGALYFDETYKEKPAYDELLKALLK
jgi:endo-1,4-beta-xylanase